MKALLVLVSLAATGAQAQEIGLSVARSSTSEDHLFSPTGIDAFAAFGTGALGFRAGVSRGSATRTVNDETFCRGGPHLPGDSPAEQARNSVTVTTGTVEGVLRNRVGQPRAIRRF